MSWVGTNWHASAMEKESTPIPNPSSAVPVDVPSTIKSEDISGLREELNEFKNKNLHKAINKNFAKVFEYMKVNQTTEKGADSAAPVQPADELHSTGCWSTNANRHGSCSVNRGS